jgi:hypothetical protein
MITVSVEHVRDSQTSKITQRKPEERTIREIHARQTRIAKKKRHLNPSEIQCRSHTRGANQHMCSFPNQHMCEMVARYNLSCQNSPPGKKHKVPALKTYQNYRRYKTTMTYPYQHTSWQPNLEQTPKQTLQSYWTEGRIQSRTIRTSRPHRQVLSTGQFF